MKLKYYLRGLGTGIAVTALIIGISAIVSRKEVMTDEEVIARAKELGMVERTVLSELSVESDEKEEESEQEIQMSEESELETKTEEESLTQEIEEQEAEKQEAEKPIEDAEEAELTEEEPIKRKQ